MCIFKQQPQKSHEQDIVPKNHLQIDLSFFESYRTPFMKYFASLPIFMHQGHRMQKKQNEFILLPGN